MNRSEIDKILELQKASPRSGGKKIFGVGVNDSSFATNKIIDGKRKKHRAYSAWYHILSRCYNRQSLDKNPTYADVEVCDEWLNFSGFFDWWKDNHVDGWDIDKDLLKVGNRVYSPETCIYIPHEINALCYRPSIKESSLPIGVYFDSEKSMYKSQCRDGRTNVHLGYFNNANDAHRAWILKKIEIAKSMRPLMDSINPSLFNGVISKIKSFSHDVEFIDSLL